MINKVLGVRFEVAESGVGGCMEEAEEGGVEFHVVNKNGGKCSLVGPLKVRGNGYHFMTLGSERHFKPTSF